MPNNKWSFRLILATCLMLITGAFAPAAWADTSTPGGGGYTAPAPTKVDASGTSNDGFYIPEADFEGMFIHPDYSYGGYRLDGRGANLEAGFHKLPKGASGVTITADWDSGTWTFDEYTDDDLGKEAENKYWATLGECAATTSSRTAVTLFVTNVDDDTNLPIKKLTVGPYRPKDPIPVTYDVAEGIQDGETREIPIMEYQGGLFPGTWRLNIYIGGFKEVAASVVVWVPACGDATPPTGDHPPGQEITKPKASVKQLMCRPPRVRATFNNRASTRPVTFKLVKNGRLLKSVRLKAGETKRVVKKAKPRSRVKVVANGKVLTVKTIKRYRHC